MSAAFDTLKYAKRLKEAGVPEEQAEIHAEALRGVLEEQVMARFDKVDERFDKVSERFDKVDDKLQTLERRLDRLEEHAAGRFTLLQWMLAFNLALTVAVLWMLIRT